LAEAPLHPHNAARGTFLQVDGVMQPAPAPRFSAEASAPPRMATGDNGADTTAVLADLGYSAGKIAALKQDRVLA
jgi:alpha-methylacyl-CoA racemase